MDRNEFELIKNEIISIVMLEPILMNQLIEKIPFKSQKSVPVIQWLLDNEVLNYNNEKKICLTGKHF